MCPFQSPSVRFSSTLSLGVAHIGVPSTNSRFLGRTLEPGFCRFWCAASRSVLSALLLLSFLAPYCSGFLIPLLWAKPVCKIKCCHDPEMCSKKKTRARRSQLEWTRSSSCCPSCSQVPSLPRAKCVGLPWGSMESRVFSSEVSLEFCARVLKFAWATASVCYQRPPPLLQ